jgi:probable phosphoglycerate mutase
MAILLLIRHAENDYYVKGKLPGRLPGIHLNEPGRQKADALAIALNGVPLKAVYSSPLERAIETAQPLASKMGLEIQIHGGLNELDCGDWKGKSVKRLKKLKAWETVQGDPSNFCFPGGESFLAAQQRVCNTLLELSSTLGEEETAACFSHCDIIRLAVAYFLNMPINDFRRVSAEPASITTLYLGKDHPRLVNLNLPPDRQEVHPKP